MNPRKELLRLTTEARYTIIARTQQWTQVDVPGLCGAFGLCSNTIKSAIAWNENPYALGNRGRPRILQEHHMQYIEMRTVSDPFITNARLADEMVAFYPDLTHLSATTIERARRNLALHYLPMCRNCAVTEQSQKTRVKWCQNEQQLERDWHGVVFSDESWFEIGTGRRFCWRHYYDSGENVTCAKRAHPPKLMIWGAIGYNYKSNLVFLDKNITGEVYFDDVICSGFLDTADECFGFNQWVFQQDNARPHIRKDIVEAMHNRSIPFCHGGRHIPLTLT